MPSNTPAVVLTVAPVVFAVRATAVIDLIASAVPINTLDTVEESACTMYTRTLPSALVKI